MNNMVNFTKHCETSIKWHSVLWSHYALVRRWSKHSQSWQLTLKRNCWIFHHTPSKNYWQFSSTILIQFSCNSHAIIDEIFRNTPAILTYNSHPILTRQYSSNSHQTIFIQFSPTILIQFSPDNSHPIFTWQFSSNFHLTILIQFSPTILTQFSSTLLSQFSPTMLSQFSRNDQPICSHQSCCYFYSMLIL